MTILTNHGESLDITLEHEILAPIDSKGFKVTLKYNQESGYKAPDNLMIKRNVTEVHWKYPSPISQEMVAIESDIHSTGMTVGIEFLDSLKIELETDDSKSFHNH